jgi:hypothetical protein
MRSSSIPLEPASRNKEMGRVLLRRGGETIGAGERPSFSGSALMCCLMSFYTGIVLETRA